MFDDAGAEVAASADDSSAATDATRGAETARQQIHSHAAGRRRKATREVH